VLLPEEFRYIYMFLGLIQVVTVYGLLGLVIEINFELIYVS